MSTIRTVPNKWLEFSYIRSEYYELYQNFDDTELKKSDHTSNDKFKLFCGIIVVIEEEWFDDMNLTDGKPFRHI